MRVGEKVPRRGAKNIDETIPPFSSLVAIAILILPESAEPRLEQRF